MISRPYRLMRDRNAHAETIWCQIVESPGPNLSFSPFGVERVVTLRSPKRVDFAHALSSSGGSHSPPRVRRFTAELAKRSAGDQMTLDIESVVDGGVGGEKS